MIRRGFSDFYPFITNNMTEINRPLHYNTEIPNDDLNIRLISHSATDEIMFFSSLHEH